jgi:predicted membrane chloride channel (bestrophin family)
MNINHTRDLVRMGTAWYDDAGISPERREKDLKALSLATWAFVRAMKRHLSPPVEDEEDFKKEILEKLPKGQAEAIIKSAHRPNRALFDLSMAIENLPMHWLRKNEINKAVTIFEDNLGSSERLLSSPVPLFYSRHTARFLFFWLAGIPFALYDQFDKTWNHVGMVPASAIIALFLFGIDELANQLEEPFTILPMQSFCDKIGNWCNEIVSWTPGDNGSEVYSKEDTFVLPTEMLTNGEKEQVESSSNANCFSSAINGHQDSHPEIQDTVIYTNANEKVPDTVVYVNGDQDSRPKRPETIVYSP